MLEKVKVLYKKCQDVYKKYAENIEQTIKESKKYGEIDPAFRYEFINIINRAKNLQDRWNKWIPIWEKEKDWDKFRDVYEEIYKCKACDLNNIRFNKNRLKVPGAFTESNTSIPVLVVSEAPGYYEETTSWDCFGMEFGYPFQGRAGKTFKKMCEVAGIDRFDLFITNVLKCSDKNEEVKNSMIEVNECYQKCVEFLEKQLVLYKPVIIWTLGATANDSVNRIIYNLDEDIKGDQVKISYAKNSKSVTLTKNFVVINNAHPAYISRKEKDYWFIRKERATIELIKVIINIFKENHNG